MPRTSNPVSSNLVFLLFLAIVRFGVKVPKECDHGDGIQEYGIVESLRKITVCGQVVAGVDQYRKELNLQI